MHNFLFVKRTLAVFLCALTCAGCQRNAESASPVPAHAKADAAPVTAGSSVPARAPAASTDPAAPAATNLDTLPVSTAQLPPFPFLDFPTALPERARKVRQADFAEAYVILDSNLHRVEGRVEERSFKNKDANLTEAAARGNYEALIRSLGAVKVSQVKPNHGPMARAHGGPSKVYAMLRYPDWRMTYDTYVLRTPQQRYWIVLMVSERMTRLIAIEEQAMQQKVGFVKADAMRAALASTGRIALYINFDTDKATIRPDGKPAVDEIVTLMNNDAALKLKIEGHTDNSGTSEHNKDLSQRRADVVMATLVAAGIDKNRLSAVGWGDSKPLSNNDDESGRALNRRVELVKQP